MGVLEFKYTEALSKIEQCPNSDCVERARDGFRWVHGESSDSDFVPLANSAVASLRPIDESDLERHCVSWGLSFFDSLEAAKTNYKQQLNRRRGSKRADFITQKGDRVAFIPLQSSHGKSSPSNNNSHFTLFEFKGVNLHGDITEIFNIFDSDEKLGKYD